MTLSEKQTAMRVPLLDLKAQYKKLQLEILAALSRVLENQQFILGEEVRALEEEVGAYCGTRFAVGVSSGTDALLAALTALSIGPGDEVITTPFTFFATAGVVARMRARPVFVDIEPDSFNINPKGIERAVGPKTKAIIPVHLFGRCAAMKPLTEIARMKNIAVVEDAAQAIGASSPFGKVGTMGDVACLSFYPSKNLGGFGDGGMVVTQDEGLCERLKRLRTHGSVDNYVHLDVGGNFRLDALQAAVLRVKLRYLDEWTERRREVARRYNALFRETNIAEADVRLPVADEGHVFNQYVIRAKNRDALQGFLREKDIQSAVYYPVPLHFQPCFKYLGFGKGDFPESERAAQEVLALPIYPEISPEAQEYVVNTIRQFYISR